MRSNFRFRAISQYQPLVYSLALKIKPFTLSENINGRRMIPIHVVAEFRNMEVSPEIVSPHLQRRDQGLVVGNHILDAIFSFEIMLEQ